jgi:hypothetical protein|tara:strand:+ start:4351 stop:4713 length:363 start_codon:yes stop_codon:yes gene_type:complete
MILDTLSFMQESIGLRLDYAEDLLAEEPLITRLEPPGNQLLKVETQPVVRLSDDERNRIDASWAERSKNYLACKEEQKEEQKRDKERERQKEKRILEACNRVLAKRIAKRPNRYGFFTFE